jgi:plastocyanin
MRNEFGPGVIPGVIARRGMLRATLLLAGGMALLGVTRRVAAADAPQIRIDNFKFAPTPLTVPKGATVTWVNQDDMPHSIVCQALEFHSKPMDTDGSISLRFDQPGRYDYVCGLHPFMRGQVIVQG